MSIKLITDSTCDLSPALLHSKGIGFAPLKVLFGAEEFIDKVDITNETFYQKMRTSEDLPTTSQVNPGEFYELFKEELSKGNQIVGVFISGELSGTYNSAVIAKEMIGSDNIHLIDSRTASFSLALIVLRLQRLIDSGASIEQVVEEGKILSQKAQLYGMLDTLENLKRGGRLSSGAAMIGKILNLKPIIEVKEGIVNMASKARGPKKGIAWMIEQLENDYPNKQIKEIALAYAYDYSKIEDLKAQLSAKFEIGDIHEIEIGSVVGTHTGEGVLGIAYFRP